MKTTFLSLATQGNHGQLVDGSYIKVTRKSAVHYGVGHPVIKFVTHKVTKVHWQECQLASAPFAKAALIRK